MIKIISSQEFRDEEIVNIKRIAKDYDVLLSPVFEVDSEVFQVVLDGHHSYEAAKLDGVQPHFTVASATLNDNVALLASGDVETFLETQYIDGPFRDVETGEEVW